MEPLSRRTIFPERALPDWPDMLAEGQRLAQDVQVGPSAFLNAFDVPSEHAFKSAQADAGRIMQHAQIGFRSLDRTIEAAETIHREVIDAGYRVDRYGICLDWSMGYPKAERDGRPKGTGLILDDEASFARLANTAPVAPHFGDFVIGMPSALENTAAALRAGSTAIGNMGQYFTFELPGWSDDVARTRATVTAIALAAAQPVPILIHSNIDDGFAARFSDLACALGAVMLEIYVVDDLIGGRVSHCYGHTFSKPLSRFAFQRALLKVSSSPGTMVYGNTTGFGRIDAENYAALAAYLSVDIQAQRLAPSGHAINPVPITEAFRIPDIDEVVAAQVFCGQLIKRSQGMEGLADSSEADALADKLVEGGTRFKQAVLEGLSDAGIDIRNPFEVLLSMRRIGAKRLEVLFGPGPLEPVSDKDSRTIRHPIEPSPVLGEITELAARTIAGMSDAQRAAISGTGLKVVTATTDVHEYGKRLLDEVFTQLDVGIVDGGISTDPDKLAALSTDADAVFVSTYNGVALGFVQSLMQELKACGTEMPVFVGGKLNQVPADSNSNLPVNVDAELKAEGAIVCYGIEDLFDPLAELAGVREKEAS